MVLVGNLFVQMGVRFISLAEGVDSYLNPDSVNSIIVMRKAVADKRQ